MVSTLGETRLTNEAKPLGSALLGVQKSAPTSAAAAGIDRCKRPCTAAGQNEPDHQYAFRPDRLNVSIGELSKTPFTGYQFADLRNTMMCCSGSRSEVRSQVSGSILISRRTCASLILWRGLIGTAGSSPRYST